MEQVMKNNTLYPKDSLPLPQGSGLIYEVIRVIDGAALFFREHYDRFLNSGANIDISYLAFLKMTAQFIESLDKDNFNLKVILDPTTKDLYLFENPSSYPEASLYETGVHTELMDYLRNDPNAKITNQELTDLANQKRTETGAYELLLVDPSGDITEGSRSNLFFIQDGNLLTPPLDSVLPGVTRQRIIETAQAIHLTVLELRIKANQLSEFQGAFISGTSPKILPIRSVGSLSFNSAQLPLVKELMTAFDQTIFKDLKDFRQQVKQL
ncbi:MAG: aminotransferase class IV [Clostridium sp.]|jgi:branched-chain amino acid aminotransferase|nr:aminotransferase class IV [Clostridium sp.]